MTNSGFIHDCILEALELDHESLELLMESVKEACIDNSIQYDDEILLGELTRLVESGKVEPSLYDPKIKNLIATDFKKGLMNQYWYRLKK